VQKIGDYRDHRAESCKNFGPHSGVVMFMHTIAHFDAELENGPGICVWDGGRAVV
jgi:hypothetical protein